MKRTSIGHIGRWAVGSAVLLVLLGWLAVPRPLSPFPEKLRAIQYFQPDANLRTFWSHLDQRQLIHDLEVIRSSGFNAVILMVPWGEFQPSIEPVTYDEQLLRLLQEVIRQAMTKGLWVILRMGSHEFVPTGAQGGDWWAGTVLTNEQEFAAYRDFFRRIAEETRGYPRMVYFWSWEDTYLWPQPWYNELPDNRRAWREWCRGRNPSLEFWNQRWEEHCETWDDVELPDSRRYAGGSKVGDFWAFADDAILQRAPALASALRTGNPRGIIGFEARIDPDDTYHHRRTFQALADYDFVASWYYPYHGVPLTHVAPLLDVGKAIRELALQLYVVSVWSRKPVFFEQIGAAVRAEDLEHQRVFLVSATDFLLTNALGYGIWAWQDYVLNSVYNPGFERSLMRWRVEGPVDLVEDPAYAQAGSRVVRLHPGARIQQDLSGHGGRFCSCWVRLDGEGEATLHLTIERYEGEKLVDRQERTVSAGSSYRFDEVEWDPAGSGSRARIIVQAAPENTAPVLVDTIRCYSFTSYLGLCDAQGQPRQPLVDQLAEINRRTDRSLVWRLRHRWWVLARYLGLAKARVDEASEPGEGL